jgi:nitrate/TMAO reductase-like tetraheme cytochrome c subunit
MKTVKQTFAIILGLLFLSLQGCSHDDYIPVPGPAGADGTNGTNGTTSCETCHSVEHKTPIIAAYSLSKHFLGTTVARGTGVSTIFADGSLNAGSSQFCSQCHTAEGYIDKAKFGSTNPAGYALTSKISCESCHGTTHRSFNFATDGNDFGLRRVFAVPYMNGVAGATMDASLTGKVSTSNTCIACHQVRPADGISSFWKRPDITLAEKDFTGNPVILNTASGLTYKYWTARDFNKAVNGYPASALLSTDPVTGVKTYGNYRTYSNTSPSSHDGPQADIWMGKSGIDIDGTTTHLPDSKTGTSHYSKGVSCVSCHMDKPKADGTEGSHSLELSYVSCNACHTAGDAAAKVTALNTVADAELQKLVAAFGKYPTYFKVTVGATFATSSVALVLTTDDAAKPWPTAVANGPLTTTWNTGKTMPLKYAQAFWNLKLLTGRGGSHNAVHNPSYFKALIQNSIEALN